VFTLTGSTSRTWNLLVSQLECGSLSLPPTGCLQHHTGSTGTVRSFNWQDSDTSLIHLQSQFYSVCIRKELGYCKIGWKQSGDERSFQLGRLPVTQTTAANEGTCANSNNDYILIPDSSNNDARTPTACCTGSAQLAACNDVARIDKYCYHTLTCIAGSSSPAEVVTSVIPFTLGVSFNDAETNEAHLNRGFKLNYRQIPC